MKKLDSSWLSGYVLFRERPVLIRGYLFALGAAGLIIGGLRGYGILTTLSAFLLGAYFSPLFPIWRDVRTDEDKRLVLIRNAGPEWQVGYWYWSLPLAVVLLILQCALGSLGW